VTGSFESVVVPRLREGHAEFPGPMRDTAKYELLGGSTALVLLPNYADPCPVVALEALATGTPVVALARGGLPELVTDGVTGLIADDLQSLLHKLPGLGQIVSVLVAWPVITWPSTGAEASRRGQAPGDRPSPGMFP
jgi:glycosyltransferase involved in cell wall biosynthesis